MIHRLHQWFSRFFQPGSTGARGEQLACDHLASQGYAILSRNLRAGRGEIDILARSPDGKCLVVVEVKTSAKRHQMFAPELRVNARKRQKLQTTAMQVIRRFNLQNLPMRFDVIAVELPEGQSPVIRHIPGAFESRY